jgi:hypothetical protein
MATPFKLACVGGLLNCSQMKLPLPHCEAVKLAVCTSAQPVLLIVIGPAPAPAGTVVEICVSLLTVKVAATLLANFTAVTPVKFVPVIVTTLPTTPLVGVMFVTAGQAGLIWNVSAFETPPPGAGLKTVTLAVPAAAMSLAGICAVNCVPLTTVVVRSLPFHLTIEPPMKFVPLTVSVKPTPPAAAALGVMLVNVGVGLVVTPACVTVKVCPAIVIVPVRELALVLAATE